AGGHGEGAGGGAPRQVGLALARSDLDLDAEDAEGLREEVARVLDLAQGLRADGADALGAELAGARGEALEGVEGAADGARRELVGAVDALAEAHDVALVVHGDQDTSGGADDAEAARGGDDASAGAATVHHLRID